jgi:ADP-heptose:LPS heptosyltransferase
LISVQKGAGAEQLETFRALFPIVDLASELDDFVDTAAAMKSLDLVITADTAVAHLAGALGVPVWVALPFNPDWRWLLDRSDSPWYPSMRLFRQKALGDWSDVLARMAAALPMNAPK